MEAAVENPQPGSEVPAPAAPAAPPVETSVQPEKLPGVEGAGKDVETEETPQKRESRRTRQLNRERERRVAAETELRIMREQQAKPQPQPTDKPQADEGPKREQYPNLSYEDFLDLRAEWKADQVARKVTEEVRKNVDTERNRGEQEKAAKAWTTQVDKARDEVEDFDEVCAESASIVTAAMSEAIVESDKGALIAYYLAKNPAEAERISKLSKSKQAAAIVGLEDKVAKPAKKPSTAPDPITPVGQKAELRKDISDPNLSDAEFNAMRKKQLAARR